MKKCYLCSISESEAVLYEGIHKKEGIVNVCRKCYHRNKIPLIEKKNILWKEVDRRKTVRERLSKIAKIDQNYKNEKIINFEDNVLKEIVEKNFKKDISKEIIKAKDLVDNFNWVIMRRRRERKITKEELAREVLEPLIVVESLERGILPRDYLGLVKKIENHLGIKLFKEKQFGHRDILNESRIPSGILISELKKVNKKKENNEINEDYLDASEINLTKVNEISGIPEKIKKKKEIRKISSDGLSDEDIGNLIWGK